MRPTLLFAGAPSGGHLYPGLAVAARLQSVGNCEAHFLSTGRELEASILGGAGVSVHQVSDRGVRSPLAWSRAVREVREVFDRVRPAGVVGLGGAPSVLPALMAVRRRIPVFLLEQNRVLGRANRWLGRLSTRVFLSYPDTRGGSVLRRRGVIVGCPVRAAFQPTIELPRSEEAISILILGGSQGARAVNELAPLALDRLDSEVRSRIRVLHVAGSGKADGLREVYRQSGIRAEVTDYLEDPASALAASALVLGRSGGSTVAELMAVGRGALLLPYPHHKDRHQFLNAEWLESRGAARICAETVDAVSATLRDLLRDPAALSRMANRARDLGRPDAADRIATTLLTHLDALPPDHPVVAGEAAAA